MKDDDQAAPEYSQKWWCAEIAKAEKRLDEKWRSEADKIVDRYLDVRGTNDSAGGVDSDSSTARRYNIFWANVQIIKSALYATPPRPSVTRAHGDAKDDVARTAALILQRILQFDFDKDSSDIHEAISLAVDDRLIPGLGQVWLRYEVDTEPTEPVKDPLTGTVLTPAGTKIVDERVCTEYTHWRDFLFSPVRTWGEKWWLGRRCWMRKKAFVRKFGADKWDELREKAKEHGSKQSRLPLGFADNRAEVFELWCEDSNTIYWIHKALDEVLLTKEDFLKLDEFYPCPKPLLATHTTNDFIPRADYTMAQDQYEELDTLNQRISILTKALRVVGVYDKTSSELGKILSGGEFNMIPVDNWAAFAESGGLKGVVDWFPVDVIAGVLEKLMLQRAAVIQQIYELTSISDIQRGASNPRETLGAQKLKAQYSSVRLQLNQQDVSHFVSEILHLKCEIICRIWQPETIRRVSQIDFTESAPYAEEAIKLLKQYEHSQYRIRVSEEQLSLADYNAEREKRTEFLQAVGQFVSQLGQMAQYFPSTMPYMLQMIQWVLASFRGSEDIETVMDQAIEAAKKPPAPPAPPAPPPPPPPDPAKMAAIQQKAQADQGKLALDAQKLSAEVQMNREDNQTAVLIEQLKQGQADKELAQEAVGMALEQQENETAREHEREMGERDQQFQGEQSEADREAAAQAAKAKGSSK